MLTEGFSQDSDDAISTGDAKHSSTSCIGSKLSSQEVIVYIIIKIKKMILFFIEIRVKKV